MIKTKKQMFIIIGVFTLVMLLGTVSYAFFNYARTGNENSISTGKIFFVSSETGGPISISNFFPVDSEGVSHTNANDVSSVTVNIEGGTTYENGIDYTVSLVNVSGTMANVPITIEQTATNLGATSGSTGTRYIAEVDSGETYLTLNSSQGSQIIGHGHIDANANAGNSGASGNTVGTILISAGIASNVAITDTPNDEYTTSWVSGRSVMSTSQWNALADNPITFNVRIVADETPREDSGTQTAAEYLLANVQTLETVPYGKVYTGSNPNNYVIFNNETWRILGVYNDKLKIVRATPSTTSQAYDADANDWSTSDMKSYLYDTYWESSLNSSAKQMVEQSAAWNVGSYSNEAASTAYTNASNSTYIGKIGLIAGYEYLYAAENDGTCWSTTGSNYNTYITQCADKDWLWNTLSNNKANSAVWLISPFVSEQISATLLHSAIGTIQDGLVTHTLAASPVVYLKPEVMITGGSGESGGNEYTLSYTAS